MIMEERKPLGLLAGLTDPKLRAEIGRRSYIVDRIAEQMGISRRDASDALRNFEADTSSEGQTLH